MGYWKTHTGLEGPSRDSTYDMLPVFLGILPDDGPPEELNSSEAAAAAVFDAADSLTIFKMKAELLAAKLNALKFPGFADALFPDGTTVNEAIAAGDQVLDDVANSSPRQNSEVEAIKDLLEAANNNSTSPTLFVNEPGCILPEPTPTPTPTPTPVVAPVSVGPSAVPSGLPNTGGSPLGEISQIWAVVIALALIVLGSFSLTASRKRDR